MQEPIDKEAGIVLIGFDPRFGLPSASPFDMKTEVQLKMMGLDYRKTVGSLTVAPKGKLPLLSDHGTIISDSTLIRFHLEEKYSVDLDAGLSDTQRAIAWAAEKLVEDNLYWAMVWSRWVMEENFQKGPARVFDQLPQEIRDSARQRQRDNVFDNLKGQGLGRHSPEEIVAIAQRGYWALSKILGGQTYLTGDQPCGADASVFAQIACALTDFFESPVRDCVASHSNLVEYHRRLMDKFFPAFSTL